MIDYTILPEHMREGAQYYVEHGVEPGSFMLSVLSNDFAQAALRADHINSMSLLEWASWLYNEAPEECWGSRKDVQRWIKHRGLEGL